MPMKMNSGGAPPQKNDPEEIKSIMMATSRIINRPDDLEGGEETEIAVQISVPHEGGWGWVVVAAAFSNVFLLDGIAFTYGSIMSDVAKDFDINDSLSCLVNSIAIAMYFGSGPIAGAMINRYGFRACVLAGAIISSSSLFISYFLTNFHILCFFYGFTAGFGYGLINMSSSLIVGFYFERLRSLALAIAASGSSMGIMVQYPAYTYIAQLAGWRTTALLHCCNLTLVYFLGMSFRPLLSVTIRAATDETQGTRTVTYLPTVATISTAGRSSKTKVSETLQSTPAERLFTAVSNVHFPTAAATLIKEREGILASLSLAGPSSAAAPSKLVISAREPAGGFSMAQLKQIKAIMSKGNVAERIEAAPHPPSSKKVGFFSRFCRWTERVPEDRPLYRDDVFYEGNVKRLPTYQKSIVGVPQDELTGLEYRLAVSRAATVKDLREHRGMCTTAMRRVLATMLDPTLLQKKSFILMCASAFVFYVGYLVPYVFIAVRNRQQGISEINCDLFVSCIGFANTIGRLALGYLSTKVDPLKLFQCTCATCGVLTIMSCFSYNVYYQYLYCLAYGFSISCITSLRSTVIVNLYGLDKLTNATGILLLFQGIGSLLGTPLAGVIKDAFGFTAAFVVAGIFIVIGASMLLPVGILVVREQVKADAGSSHAKAKKAVVISSNASIRTK